MIKSITIEIEGKPVELTLEQARKLKAELDEIFQEPAPIRTIIWPYIPPTTPTIYPTWHGKEVICKTTL